MRPTLQLLADGNELTARELREALANELDLTAEDRVEAIPSGQTALANRTGWAVTYLVKARALDRPRRGVVQITERGRELLSAHPDRIGVRQLKQFSEFQKFQEKRADPAPAATVVQAAVDEASPTDAIQEIISRNDQEVGTELLQSVYDAGELFLEELSLRLLRAMGYGGSNGQLQRTAQSNDAGLDGIIHQDALGLDLVGVQAKCYATDATIDRPKIQGFVGALQGAQTQRGVFVTTATFSKGAKTYAEGVSVRVVLIDGPELAKLMLRYRIGVDVRERFELVELNESYFQD